MPKPSDILAGTYRVERTIGTGGMGLVVAAIDLRTRAPVALKLLSVKDDDIAVQRFFREARAAMNLNCDHVVRVIEVGSMDGAQPFMVMERLNGQDLAAAVRGQKMIPVQETIDIAIDVCDALAHAHAAGIVHRDIKLSNLFWCEPDKNVKVLDFGISKSQEREVWERTLTRTGADAVLGSPPFMSPEQIRTPKSVDGRADIWAMGIVLYRILCGKMPFDGETVGELFASILERDPPYLVTVAPHVPPVIANIVHRCLARDKQARYATVGQVAKDLYPYTTKKNVADALMKISSPAAVHENVGTMSLDGALPGMMAGSPGRMPAAMPPRQSNPSYSHTPVAYSQTQQPSSIPGAAPSRPSYPSQYPSSPSYSATGSGPYAIQHGQQITGPQPMWNGATLSPEIMSTPVGTFSGQPKRWPWMVLSLAAVVLASVLAWSASNNPVQPGAASSSHAPGPLPTVDLVPPPPSVATTPSGSNTSWTSGIGTNTPSNANANQNNGSRKKPPVLSPGTTSTGTGTSNAAGNGTPRKNPGDLHGDPYANP